MFPLPEKEKKATSFFSLLFNNNGTLKVQISLPQIIILIIITITARVCDDARAIPQEQE